MLKNRTGSRTGNEYGGGKRDVGYNYRLRGWKGKSLFCIRKKPYDYESGHTLAQVVQKCQAISTFEVFKNLTRKGSEKPDLTWKMALL